MFAYLLEIVIVLIFLVGLFFLFRTLIRSTKFAAFVGETIDTSTADAEATLIVAEDKADRAITDASVRAENYAKQAKSLANRRGNAKPGRNQFE